MGRASFFRSVGKMLLKFDLSGLATDEEVQKVVKYFRNLVNNVSKKSLAGLADFRGLQVNEMVDHGISQAERDVIVCNRGGGTEIWGQASAKWINFWATISGNQYVDLSRRGVGQRVVIHTVTSGLPESLVSDTLKTLGRFKTKACAANSSVHERQSRR